jgi:hypothetical protein
VTEYSLLCFNYESAVVEVQKREVSSEYNYSFKITKAADEVANRNYVMEYCSDPQCVILLDMGVQHWVGHFLGI